jgi:hypothetical protein
VKTAGIQSLNLPGVQNFGCNTTYRGGGRRARRWLWVCEQHYVTLTDLHIHADDTSCPPACKTWELVKKILVSVTSGSLFLVVTKHLFVIRSVLSADSSWDVWACLNARLVSRGETLHLGVRQKAANCRPTTAPLRNTAERLAVHYVCCLKTSRRRLKYNFSIVWWVWILVSHDNGRNTVETFWERGAEGNTLTFEGCSNWSLDRTA